MIPAKFSSLPSSLRAAYLAEALMRFGQSAPARGDQITATAAQAPPAPRPLQLSTGPDPSVPAPNVQGPSAASPFAARRPAIPPRPGLRP
jgi:hypothetical protein